MAEVHGFPKAEMTTATEGVSEQASEIHVNHNPHLPPVDQGVHDWIFLAASFVIKGLVWGELSGQISTAVLR